MRRPRCVLPALLALCVVSVCSLSLGDELTRHGSWAAAQAASRTSGKFIFVYIYEHNQEGCLAMESTFSDAAVVRALQGYEMLALNGDARQNREFCEHYRVGTRYDEGRGGKEDGRMAFAAIPALLFLDYNGREYYRTYGSYAPDTFLLLLGQVARVIEYQCALAQRPQDARVHADLGRLYLEMGRTPLGKPLLETAIKLDPDNTTGARADAELDLIILSIPADPVMALRSLVAYQFNHPETKRLFEIHFYMAVAQLAAGREDQAEKILLDFAAIPPFLNDDHGLQGVQYGYLAEKEGRQVCFCDVDNIDQARQKVRDAKEDPDKCRFTRKAINPDYRNPWTEKADLLLQQLRAEQQKRKPAPK